MSIARYHHACLFCVSVCVVHLVYSLLCVRVCVCCLVIVRYHYTGACEINTHPLQPQAERRAGW